MEFKIRDLKDGADVTLCERAGEEGVTYVDVKLTLSEESVPGRFCIKWRRPNTDCYSTWSPSLKGDRHIAPFWQPRKTDARLASWMPIQSVISVSGQNRACVSLSDAFIPTRISTGSTEDAKYPSEMEYRIDFFTVPTAPIKEYNATIRIDERDIPYYDSIYDAAEWWENECGYKPAYVPDSAKMPMNSLWYSLHQNLNPKDILEQCRLSKPLGMDTVLIDDGWQTEDSNLGYSYCGDWELAKSKIPDMKKLVDDIHKLGMKVMLWYSVPYIGIHSKAYGRFRDMLLDGGDSGWACADPRYKEVREYLTDIYVTAVREWGLDGLKLDFIDAFELKGKSLEPDPRRDYSSLEDGTDALLRDVTDALKAINPEIMVEFRQRYIGPAIRKYGNMLRVADCPNDSMRNRLGIVDMRLTSGKTPVHSDMIMWNYNENVESAALQFASILYSVPQVSVLIDRLNPQHYEMLKYYLSFWRAHRDVLLDGKLTATQPESCYGTVRADLDGRSVITLYNETIIDGIDKEAAAVNASGTDSVYVKNCAGRSYKITDCMGHELENGVFADKGISEIKMPLCSIIFIK